jgi:hypothetical protein
MFAFAIAEDRRLKRPVCMPACPQGWTATLLRRDLQHQSLPMLRRPEASV